MPKTTIEINITKYFKNHTSLDILAINNYLEKCDEVIFSGNYCRFILEKKHPVRGVYGRYEYNTFYCNKSNDSEREKAAFFISNLPSDYITDGRVSLAFGLQWITLKDDAIRICKCFLHGHNNYFLANEVQKDIIDKYRYDYIWLVYDNYDILWKLLYNHQNIFKDYLSQYPDYCFNSLREVFEEIVRNDFDGQLAQCLQKCYVYKVHEIKRIFIFKQKLMIGEKLSKEEEEEFNRLKKIHYIPNKLKNLVFSVAIKRQDIESIKTLLMQKLDVENALSRHERKKYYYPEYKNHLSPSHTWERGEKSLVIKKGWEA